MVTEVKLTQLAWQNDLTNILTDILKKLWQIKLTEHSREELTQEQEAQWKKELTALFSKNLNFAI